LLRRKWWVVLTTGSVFLLVLLYNIIQDPLYSASSLVLIEERGNSQRTQLQIGPRDLFAQDGRSLQNELVILRSSRSLRQAVAERLIQQDTVPLTGAPIGLLRNEDGESYSAPQVSMLLERRVQFAPAARETDVIRITAYSSDAAEAAFIANAYLEEYLALTRQSSRSQLSASRNFLENQAEKRQDELQSIEARIKQYQRSERAVALDQEGQNLVERIATVEANRDEAQVELQTSEASLASLEEELRSIRPEDLSRRVASGVERELEATQTRIAELELSKKQVLLRANPDALTPSDSAQVAQIDRRIRELRNEAQRLSDDYVSEVLTAGSMGADEGVERVKQLRRQIAEERVAITGLTARIDVLNERLQEYERELASIPEQAMQLAQLERDRTYAEERFQAVIEQLQETRIQEETELGYADPVTQAAVPLAPIQPRTLRNLVVGLFFGFLLGLGLAVGRDKLDGRLYKPDALRAATRYPLLGTVPNFDPVIKDKLEGRTSLSVGDREWASSLIVQARPSAAASEAYRRIRTSIQLGSSDGAMETLLVTSPGAGDGKSVTAANMAIGMAQGGSRTLLIDADLRRPRAHELFGLDRSPGLAEALAPGIDDPPAVQSTPVENLHVLTAGRSVDRPAEYVSSATFQSLLPQLKTSFDCIIVDTPPVLAATEAAYLTTQCDGAMIVVRAGVTTSQELDLTLRELSDVQAPVIGTVFNGFDVSMAYGHTFRYRNYTRYGPYDDYQEHTDPPYRPAKSRWAGARDSLQSLGQSARSGWSRLQDSAHTFWAVSCTVGSALSGSARSFGRRARTAGSRIYDFLNEQWEAQAPRMDRVPQRVSRATKLTWRRARSLAQSLYHGARGSWTRFLHYIQSFSL
jgi:capsular exopolysaccharide synthesis family protein